MSLEASVADIAIKENLEQFLVVLCVSLSVATISRVFAWFRQIPYTLLLVIVGLGLAFIDVRLVNLSPELILEIFLPPLLFEAAWNVSWRELKKHWIPIVLFAIIGVIISVLGISLALSNLTDLALPIALLVGASLSATDPVSVVALFRELGASKKLTILMEGESLFNDGVAVVAFLLLVGIPLGTEVFSLPITIASFFTFVGIGIGLGCLVGFGISYLTQRFDLPLVEQSLTLVSAYGAYLMTEELGGSGVIAVVTVGIILGNFGSRIGMNPRTRLLVSEFWDFLAFFVNSIVFLLIGDQIHFESLRSNLGIIAIAIMAVLVTRLVAIYGLASLSNKFTDVDISLPEQTVLWWGGLRGSVSIALALSVPVSLVGREEIIDTVFGVVLFTLLIQGLSTQWVLKKLDLIGDQPLRQEYTELLARRTAIQRVLDYLKELDISPDIDQELYRYKRELVQGEFKSIEEKIYKFQQEYPQLKTLAGEQLQETLLDIEANTYAELIRNGKLSNNLSPLLLEILAEAGD
ncbi:Na+/H+ antiporter [Crocosphaera sp. XPORK-15E]|uniref:Na+/H+ antiporter n=1 Tax=Crocosphaera sp. XPORK-15E TaxID=3110247 RepID=UPI002B21FA73|nr:Na+/H+ antiporter [Crocosphaera sp. XPORK-15E]MEA5537191.1 Na+/H+ antiporter [Crocosphaera sp. XPORK-15E]